MVMTVTNRSALPNSVIPEHTSWIWDVFLAQVLQANSHRLRKLDVASLSQRCRYHPGVYNACNIALNNDSFSGWRQRATALCSTGLFVRAQDIFHVFIGKQNNTNKTTIAVFQQSISRQSNWIILWIPHLKFFRRGKCQLVDIPRFHHSDWHHCLDNIKKREEKNNVMNMQSRVEHELFYCKLLTYICCQRPGTQVFASWLYSPREKHSPRVRLKVLWQYSEHVDLDSHCCHYQWVHYQLQPDPNPSRQVTALILKDSIQHEQCSEPVP